MSFAPLRLQSNQYQTIIDHCLDGFPCEACGLLVGSVDKRYEPTGEIDSVHPCRNADESTRTYTVDSRDLLQVTRQADENNLQIVSVWHSHTHTEAYPSETDVRQALDPSWIYVLVSLRNPQPEVRAYRIITGQITEIDVIVSPE